MATPINGSLGQTNNYSSINELITQWPTAAQNQGIQLSGIAFDGVETNYTNPTVISNLTLATNDNPKSGLSYGAAAGIGVQALIVVGSPTSLNFGRKSTMTPTPINLRC
jgi:hypothetical protein